MIEFTINGRGVRVNVPDDIPALWVIREELGLTGTKFGCGRGLCGSCTVHVDDRAMRSCVLPVKSLTGRRVMTIEGQDGGLERVRQAWAAAGVPQCGYCQPGQMMSAAALLRDNPSPSDDEIDSAMQGNLCRCGTYDRIRKAIGSLRAVSRKGAHHDHP